MTVFKMDDVLLIFDGNGELITTYPITRFIEIQGPPKCCNKYINKDKDIYQDWVRAGKPKIFNPANI